MPKQEAVKSSAALSASTTDLISILGDINSEAGFETSPSLWILNWFREIPNFDMIQYVEYY
jgi:hypothetical protein